MNSKLHMFIRFTNVFVLLLIRFVKWKIFKNFSWRKHITKDKIQKYTNTFIVLKGTIRCHHILECQIWGEKWMFQNFMVRCNISRFHRSALSHLQASSPSYWWHVCQWHRPFRKYPDMIGASSFSFIPLAILYVFYFYDSTIDKQK